MRLGKVTIIGVGLLGGSIGLALRERKLAREVYGFVRRKVSVKAAIQAGAVDQSGTDLLEAVRGADLIVLCTPIAQMKSLVDQMLPMLKRGAIITDVGSVKAPVVGAVHARIQKGGAHFVGSHPMAGSEKGGVGSARANLFEEAVCVVTPCETTNKSALRKVVGLWHSLGSDVLTMDAPLHDRLVSRASHLPHLLASALALQVLDPRQDKRQSKLCATGFQDATRVAEGSPEMWRDIAMANRANLVRDLAGLEKNLGKLRQMLSDGDAAGIERVLRTARECRAAWKKPAGKTCSSE